MQVFLFLFLVISMIIPFQAINPYTDYQYESAGWIQNNIPKNSLILASEDLNYMISSLSQRDTTFNSKDLFNSNINETQRISSYENSFYNLTYSYRVKNSISTDFSLNYSYFYVYIDMNAPFNNSFFIIPIILNSTIVFSLLSSSSFFSLIYSKNMIFIFEIN